MIVVKSKTRPKAIEAPKLEHRRGKTDAGIAQVVYDRLKQDYEKKLLGWVLAASWSGPQDVQLEEVDTSNRRNWQASSEDKHVSDFVDQVKDGSVKPII